MTILHITAFALRGGCEKNCYHFIAGSPQDKHNLIVLDKPGPMSVDWKEQGIDVQHADILKLDMLAFRKALATILKGSKYDLVILWSAIRLPLQLNALNGVTGQTRVYLGNPVDERYKPLKDTVLSMFFPSKSAVTLMACSQYVMASHERTGYYSGFPISVSLNPVDVPSQLKAKAHHENVINLGMVARLDPIKDHATVIHGFRKISDILPEAKLHLVGDGLLRKELEQLVASASLGDKVHFYGDVRDVYHHLHAWDIFIYATTPHEGLGSVVAEAMANGLPCVLSDLPMLRELAPTEGLASWFAPGNAAELADQVLALCRDSEKMREMGDRSWQYASEHFGAQRFIRDFKKNQTA